VQALAEATRVTLFYFIFTKYAERQLKKADEQLQESALLMRAMIFLAGMEMALVPVSSVSSPLLRLDGLVAPRNRKKRRGGGDIKRGMGQAIKSRPHLCQRHGICQGARSI
jgi:hypothetical protein